MPAVGRREAEHRRLVDRFEQAEPDCLRRQPRPHVHAGGERPERRRRDRVRRRAQRVGHTIAVLPRHLGVRHRRRPFAGHAEDAVGVELIAVARLGHRPAVRVDAVDAQAQQEPEEPLVRLLRRRAAPVVGVTRRAGDTVVRGPEPVGALRRRRRRHPVAVEDAVADLKRAAIVRRQVARRIGERLVAVVEDGGVAAEERLARIDRERRRAPDRRDRHRREHQLHRLFTMPSSVAA